MVRHASGVKISGHRASRNGTLDPMSTDPTAPDAKSVYFPNPDRAAQIYHMLIAAARQRQTLTYKIVSDTTGAFTANLGHLLGYLMRWCEREKLPPLTVLVVQTGTGKPGEGLLTSQDHDANRERVYEFNWYKIRPPLPSDLADI